MQIIRDFYQQEKEGLAPHEIFYQLLVPSEKPKATFLIIHGMEEHSDRYLDFAKFMEEQGFAVMLYDHLGHGKTAKNTENLSFIMPDNPATHLVEDAGAITDFLHQNSLKFHILLWGILWVLLCCDAYCKRNLPIFKGLLSWGRVHACLEQAWRKDF